MRLPSLQHHQKKDAKKELLTIKMNKTESVSEYYHRLFKLWQRAGTSLEDRIDQFIGTVIPGISAALQVREYKSFAQLLEDARRVEGYRKDVSNNFFPNRDKAEKPNKTSTPTPGRNAQKVTTQTTFSKVSVANTKSPHPNEKFGAVCERPEGWTGPWHDPELKAGKLTDEDREKLAKQGRCWACRGSGHRGNDLCCPKKAERGDARFKKSIVPKGRDTESDASSDSGKE